MLRNFHVGRAVTLATLAAVTLVGTASASHAFFRNPFAYFQTLYLVPY